MSPEPQLPLVAAGGGSTCIIAADGTVYVGDDERDVQAANAAGMRSVGALWGYRPLDDDPARWRADALIEAPLELLERRLLHGL